MQNPDPDESLSVRTADWNRLLSDGILTDADINTRFPFSTMTKKFGRAYIVYLATSYAASVPFGISENEWARLNGGVPDSFLEKIRDMAKCVKHIKVDS